MDAMTAAAYAGAGILGGKKGRALVRARISFQLLMWQIETRKLAEKVTAAIVWKLPHGVIYWAGIRVWANATTGPYGDIEAPAVKMDTAIKVWHDRLGGDPSFSLGPSRLWVREVVKRIATKTTRTS